MPKKTALIPMPDFSGILGAPDVPIAIKRKKVLEELGLRRPRKKYESVEERKAAAKERAKKRREERLQVLKRYKLEPKKKGPGLTKAQKKEKRRTRGQDKRQFLREMARQNPDMARKFGIDPTRFRK